MKRPSLKLRITAWFALMMFVIEALVLAFLLAVNGTVATNDPEARLVRMVEHNANRVKYNNRQFRFSRIHYNRSGVYTVLYDADGNVLQGTFPAEFTPAEPLPLSSETVRLVDCGDNEYYVYDVRVDMMVGSVWLRGVINADANGGADKPVIVSEIGAGAIYGCHDPFGEAKWSEERQCSILKEQITAVLSHPDVTGIFLWQFADVRVAEEWAMRRPRTYNNKGVVDEYRRPKMAYRTVRALLRE